VPELVAPVATVERCAVGYQPPADIGSKFRIELVGQLVQPLVIPGY
jgi:hypothetical protein